MNYISSNHAGKSGTKRTTQAEISNLLRHSFPGRVNVTVDRILDGCVLREQYSGADGHKGQSFTIYDATRKVWHKSWVTNRGELLTIEGGLQGSGVVMAGADRTAEGRERQVRGQWKPVTGGVRETSVRSLDGGKTWQPWFDLMFRPAANSGKGRNATSEVQKKPKTPQP